jgi:tRNA G18 (ribose-2'-O)-methylase SpoU
MSKKESRRQLLLRYNKARQKNVLAKPGCHDFVLVLDHLKAGFNVAKIFRTAEAFGAHAVHLVNVGPFDPAPAKGSFRKVPVVFHETFAPCYAELQAEGYTVYILDPSATEKLSEASLPGKCAFVLGHEEFGFSFEPKELPGLRRLTIPQFGSVQSLNVSVAAALVMYEFVRQQPAITR